MLKHAAKSSHRPKSSIETTKVIALVPSHLSARAAAPIPSPALTWRMGHHGIRPVVFTGITLFVPWIDVREIKVRAVLGHVQSSDHYSPHAFAINCCVRQQTSLWPPRIMCIVKPPASLEAIFARSLARSTSFRSLTAPPKSASRSLPPLSVPTRAEQTAIAHSSRRRLPFVLEGRVPCERTR